MAKVEWEIPEDQENIDWEIPVKKENAALRLLKDTGGTLLFGADVLGSIPAYVGGIATGVGSATADLLQGETPDYKKALARGQKVTETFDMPFSKAIQGAGTGTEGYTSNIGAQILEGIGKGREWIGEQVGEKTGNPNVGEGAKLAFDVATLGFFPGAKTVGKGVKTLHDKTLPKTDLEAARGELGYGKEQPRPEYTPEVTTPAGDITSYNPLTFKEWKAENKRLKATKKLGADINVYPSTKTNYETYKQQHEEMVQAEVRKMEQEKAGTTPPAYNEEFQTTRPSSEPIQMDIEGMDVPAGRSLTPRAETPIPEVNPRQGEMFLNERNPFQEGQARDVRPVEPIPQARPVMDAIPYERVTPADLIRGKQEELPLAEGRSIPYEKVPEPLPDVQGALKDLPSVEMAQQWKVRRNAGESVIDIKPRNRSIAAMDKWADDILTKKEQGVFEEMVNRPVSDDIPFTQDLFGGPLGGTGSKGFGQGGATNFGFAEWAADKIKKGMSLESFTKQLEREIGPQAKIVAQALYAQAQQSNQKPTKVKEGTTTPAEVSSAPRIEMLFKDVQVDLRPTKQLVEDLVKEGVKDITPGDVLRSRTKTGPWLQQLHPVVRNIINRTDNIRKEVATKVDDLLYGGTKTLINKWGIVPHIFKHERSLEAPLTRMGKHTYKEEQQARLGAFDMEGKTWAEAEPLLKQQGLSPEVIKTVKALRDTAEKVLDAVNEAGRKFGGPNWKDIEKIPGWMPHIRSGNYHIVIKDATGTTVYRSAVKTRSMATVAERGLKEKIGEGYTVTVDHITRKNKWNIELSPFVEALSLYKKSSKEYQTLEKAMGEIITKRGFGKLQRKDIPGYGGADRTDTFAGRVAGNKEFKELFTRYVNEGVNTTARYELRNLQRELYTNTEVKQAYPNALEVGDEFLSISLGKKYHEDFALNEVDNFFNNRPTQAISGFGRFSTGMMLLYWKASMPLQNIVSGGYMLPRMANLSDKGYKASVTQAMMQGTRDWFNWKKDPDTRALVDHLTRKGDIDPKFVEDMDIMHTAQHGVAKIETLQAYTANTITGKPVAGVTEIWGRLHAALMINNFLKNSGMHDPKLRYDAVGNEVNNVMGNYAANQRARIVKELGVAESLYSPLHTFQHQWLNQFSYYIKEAAQQKHYKGLATFVALQAMLGGLYGFVNITALDWIIDSINNVAGTNIPGPTTLIAQSGWPDAVKSGVPSQLLGWELSKTFGTPSFESMTTSAPITYGVDLGSAITTILMHAAQGNLSQADKEVFVAKLPGLYRSVGEAVIDDGSGNVYDPKRNESLKYTRDEQDKIARIFSAKSLKEAASTRKDWEMTKFKRNQMGVKDKHLDAIQAGNNRTEHVQALMAEGMTLQQIKQQLKTRQMNRMTRPGDRPATSLGQFKIQQEARKYENK